MIAPPRRYSESPREEALLDQWMPRVSWILKHISIGEGLQRHSDRIESSVNLAVSVTRIHDALRQPNGGADTPLRFNALIRQIRRDLLRTGPGSDADRLAPVKLLCNLRRLSERHAVSHRE